ncbi:DUF3310 domain-containing protein [Listeria monocytogenes]|uniref:DUF3310 domain-containing protein n=1 Tax=Listeria monocytogenes TaxID=1639 RepID=UPI001F0DFE8E|nr:DUF3310 domain-containing protein [Listeria monocytogenes]ECO1684247.1 DUF3310 domain-containing protein [Listeria monocytogenes]MCH4976201.1 DUF3310 domain-containing protein [Listeria monocytogenes]
MKLYHVETQEDYDALMVNLEEEGYRWNDKEKPTEYNCWNIFKKDTVMIIEYDIYLGETSKEYCERVYPDTPIQKYKAKQDKVAKWFDDAANAMKAMATVGVSMKNDNNDNVNNPSHYTSGGIETLDYIKAKVKDYPSYVAGNILKYVSRYEHKNGIEDLKKAQFYLNDLINWMESE